MGSTRRVAAVVVTQVAGVVQAMVELQVVLQSSASEQR